MPPHLDGQVCSTAFCVIRANPQYADSGFFYFATAFDEFVERVSEQQRGSSYPAVTDGQLLAERILASSPPRAAGDCGGTADGAAGEAGVRAGAGRHASTQAEPPPPPLHLRPRPLPQAAHVPLKETEIGPICEHWKLVPCESLCEMLTVGVVVKPSSYYVASGVPAFRSFNVREDRLVTNDLVFFSNAANDGPLSKSRLREGDVLIVRTGYPGNVVLSRRI